MAYRTKKKERIQWKHFFERFHVPLTASGVPHEVLESQRDWFYFIEHGYPARNAGGFRLDDLNREELEALRVVLEAVDRDGFEAGSSGGLLQWLRVRLGDG